MSHKLWSPPVGIRTNLDNFREIIMNKYQVQLGTKKFFARMIYLYLINLESYWDLYEWSIKNISQFWEEFWIYSEIKYSVPFEQVCHICITFVCLQVEYLYLGIRKEENE
jgi:hypothetical protein